MMKKVLVLGHQLTLYLGPLPDVGEHQHTASALCVGLKSSLFARESGATTWRPYQALFIPSGVRHALSFGDQAVAVLFFEVSSRIYRDFLARYGLSTTHLSAPAGLTGDWLSGIDALHTCETDGGDRILAEIARKLTGDRAPASVLDPRIAKTVALMHAEPAHNFTAATLAASVCLSPSRLSALFSAQTGMSLRRYRIWLRLRSTAIFLLSGMSFTSAAVAAGYSDSAHFSHSCRKLLGIKPSDIIHSEAPLRILVTANAAVGAAPTSASISTQRPPE